MGRHTQHSTKEQPALEALLQQAALPRAQSRRTLLFQAEALQHFRRVATRYDKLAANFLAMIQLASLRLWLRTYESTS